MGNTRIAISVDMDGCLFIPNKDKTLETIKARLISLTKYVYNEILSKYNDATNVHLFLGSARQTAYLDYYNNYIHKQGRYNGFLPTCFQVMEQFETLMKRKIEEEQAEFNVTYEHLLIGDVLDNKEVGHYLSEYHYKCKPIPSQGDRLSYEYNDKNKTQLIHTQTNYLASQYPHDAIKFYLIDDNEYILRANHQHYRDNNQDLPKGTELTHIQFSPESPSPTSPFSSFDMDQSNTPDTQDSSIHGQGDAANDSYQLLIKCCDKHEGRLTSRPTSIWRDKDREFHNLIQRIRDLAKFFYTKPNEVSEQQRSEFNELLKCNKVPGQPSCLTHLFCCGEKTDLAGAMQTFYKDFALNQQCSHSGPQGDQEQYLEMSLM